MKSIPNILILITTLFAGILLGLFISRTAMGGTIQVSIPAYLQTVPPETGTETAEEKPTIEFPIRLNRATKEELMALPNIGEQLADRILAYRKANGVFTSVAELKNIEGIGESTLEGLFGLIALD